MLAAACPRNLATPARRGPQRSCHEWHIPQSNQVLGRSRDLVTHAARGADPGRIPDARRARPARERRSQGPGSTRRCLDESAKRPDWRPCSRADMRWPSSSVAARDCGGQKGKTARSTSTCALQIAPSSLPDWVERGWPHRPRARQTAKSEEDGHQLRRRPVKDVDQKKTKDEEEARSNRLKKGRFGSAPSSTHRGRRWWPSRRSSRARCAPRGPGPAQ